MKNTKAAIRLLSCFSVLQDIIYCCHNPDVLYVRCRFIAAYAELPLIGIPYAAELALRVLGELLCHSARIACGFLNHLGFDVVQLGVLECSIISVSILGAYVDTLFHQYNLFLDEFYDLLDLC